MAAIIIIGGGGEKPSGGEQDYRSGIPGPGPSPDDEEDRTDRGPGRGEQDYRSAEQDQFGSEALDRFMNQEDARAAAAERRHGRQVFGARPTVRQTSARSTGR